MKKYILLMVLILTYNCNAQDSIVYKWRSIRDGGMLLMKDSTGEDTSAWEKGTTFDYCRQRGHVEGSIGSITDMYCDPYTIDEEDVTYKIYPSCNYRTYKCLRCGKSITEKEPERRIIIWRKER